MITPDQIIEDSKRVEEIIEKYMNAALPDLIQRMRQKVEKYIGLTVDQVHQLVEEDVYTETSLPPICINKRFILEVLNAIAHD